MNRRETEILAPGAPDYDSDYRYTFINGDLEHPYSLPGVDCDVCGSPWGGSRILPFECPPSLRGHPNLTDAWAISLEQHKALQNEGGNVLWLPAWNSNRFILEIPFSPAIS